MLALSACTGAKISGSGSKPILLNNLSNTEFIDNFKVSKMVVFDYSNSFNCYDHITDVIKKYPEANAFTNVQVTIKSSVGTFFVNLFTIGFAQAKVIEIKGDVVKLGRPLSELKTDDTQSVITLGQLESQGTVNVGTIPTQK